MIYLFRSFKFSRLFQFIAIPYKPGNNVCSVLVTAPTGVAVTLISGGSIDSTFTLPIEKGKSEPLRP